MSCAADQWNELLPFLFRWSTAADPTQRESALFIFSQLAAMLGAHPPPLSLGSPLRLCFYH